MPLIIPANSITGGYEVDNSCRFDDGSSDSLTRTPGSDGDRQKWTTSQWIKRGNFTGQHQNVFTCGTYSESINIRDDDKVYVQVSNNNTTAVGLMTDRVIRDPSAWYHIVVACDTTQGTASNRLKLYINGVEETSFSQDQRSSITQNMSTAICGQFEHRFGKDEGTSNYYNGYLAEAVLIDGQALDPTSFGEFDEDSGIWKPISVSGLTFGTNGFYLDFEDSSALGDDVSGNGNDFTVNNLTAIDQSTDTCTNNFATLNPLIIFGANNSEFKEGNLVYDDSRADWRAAVGTFGAQSGKWYWEMKLGSGTYHQVGIVGTTSPTSSASLIDLSQVHGGYSFYNDNGNLIARTDGADISGWDSASVGTTASTGDILMVALDMDNKFLYFGKNGTWVKSGDPTSGASGTGGINISSDFTSGIDALPGVSMYSGSDGSLNFGSPPYTISSGNADGNGYGNFEYAVPSGYYALNTKNLAEYG